MQYKKAKEQEQLDRIQRVNPSLDALKFCLEKAISPIANNTKIIFKMLSFKDIKIKLVFTVFLFIRLVYEKSHFIMI